MHEIMMNCIFMSIIFIKQILRLKTINHLEISEIIVPYLRWTKIENKEQHYNKSSRISKHRLWTKSRTLKRLEQIKS